MNQPKQYTVTIPAEVWEMSMRDAEKLAQIYKECVRLHEENERLRKAGDAMDAYLKRQDGTTNGQLPVREAWQKAKEGSDAK